VAERLIALPPANRERRMSSEFDERLARARQRVLTGRSIIERQRSIIARKHVLRIDASDSQRLLAQFEEAQTLLESGMERLMREWDKE
jgi:hypothetical protein